MNLIEKLLADSRQAHGPLSQQQPRTDGQRAQTTSSLRS